MQITDAIVLAQAVPADVDLTAGQATAGVIALLMMALSFGMGVAWVIRIAQTGSALPAASRGILRCPPALSVVAVVLTALLAVLAMVSSISDDAAGSPAGPAESTEAEMDSESPTQAEPTAGEPTAGEPTAGEPTAGEPTAGETTAGETTAGETTAGETTAGDDSAENGDPNGIALPPAPTAPPTPEPAGVQSLILTTLTFDLVLLLGFGLIIGLNRVHGRVWLASDRAGAIAAASVVDLNQLNSREGEAPMASSTMNSHWPDLDQPVTAPTDPAEPVSADAVPEETGSDGVSETESSWQSAAPAAAASAEDSHEPLNLKTELRYAGEVFAVALLPTMLLRMLVVTLYMNALNLEDVPQHPFLEVMEQRSGAAILMLIAFLAVIMAPLMEELLYRVVILGGMAQSGYVAAGMTLSSILFCLAHGFPDCVALLPLALLLGYTYLRRRSYVTVMLVHFLFNAFNLVVAGVGLI